MAKTSVPGIRVNSLSGHPDGGGFDVREAVVRARDWNSEVALKVTKPVAEGKVQERGGHNHQQPIKNATFHAWYAAQR
jgi:hypothetical protein